MTWSLTNGKNMDDFFKSAAKVMKKGGTMVIFLWQIIKVEKLLIRLAEKGHGFYSQNHWNMA